jgi:hypothetical protein
MSLAGLPAWSFAKINLPSSTGFSAHLYQWPRAIRSHNRIAHSDLGVNTPYGGASAVASHHTSLFTHAAQVRPASRGHQ